MNTARAFHTATGVQNQYAYIFGGLSDYQILNTIEKYDIITDTWISLYFKLPMPLAKLASVSLVGEKQILLMGGMSADYEPTNKVYHLDLNFSKFVNKKDMKYERLFEGGAGAFRA
jgi:N-acetylneuraminic acid mutarotase